MRIFSGIRPTGELHFGNYAGAISQWINIKNDPDHTGYFCIVDLHALVGNPPPDTLKRNIMETAAGYLAFGLKDKGFHVFVQSHVPAHSELAWILSSIAGIGELERMTQFKDKAGYAEIMRARNDVLEKLELTTEELTMLKAKGEGAHHRMVRDEYREIMRQYNELRKTLNNLAAILESREKQVRAALLNYPVLMASDILLYDTQVVPVGDDQVQHVELARSLARRFNHNYKEVFTVPKSRIQKEGARIMSLQSPTSKMSKSLGDKHYLGIFEPEKRIRKKIMSAVTDSDMEIRYDPDKKPEISNLLTILSILLGRSVEETEQEMRSNSYAALKERVADEFLSFFAEVREKRRELESDPERILKELEGGAQKASEYAAKKIEEVQKVVGLIP